MKFYAREIQHKRFGGEILNSEMSAKDIAKHITLLPEIESLLGETARTLNLSPRSYHRVLKLARTIADLDGSSSIERGHILEALQYRPKNSS